MASSSSSWREGMSSDNIKGLVLALSSSFFIGASFIVKKKGLKKAGASGIRAGSILFFDPLAASFHYVYFSFSTSTFIKLDWIGLLGFCLRSAFFWGFYLFFNG
jgi:drug/metabolite transporter (DMT)-like permease